MIALLALWACGTSDPGSPIAFPPTEARTPTTEPEGVVDGAFAALASVTGGSRIACDLPAALVGHALRSGNRRRHDVIGLDLRGPTARGAVRVPDGRVPLYAARQGGSGPDARTRTWFGGDLAPNTDLDGRVGMLRWWDGSDGRATCRFEPLDEVPFSGVVHLLDGRDPGDASIELLSAGCAWVAMDPDGTFRGARIPGENCSLFTRPSPRDGSSIELSDGAPHHDIRIEVDTAALSSPHDRRRGVIGIEPGAPGSPDQSFVEALPPLPSAAQVWPSPITDALALPGLSDEVRAQLVRWREAEIHR